MACYNSNPIIQNVQYPQPCDCCQDNGCAQQLDSKCVYYNGPALPCTEITTGDSVEEAIQKIEEKVCEVTGDYSTYNTYCLAPIATQQEFVEAISEGYCNLLDDFNTFVNVTFVNYQTSVTNQFNAIINPNITCAVASVTNTDTIYQVLNKYCTAITTLDSYTDISGVAWDCIAPLSTPNNLEEGFEILVGEICNLYSIMPSLPMFNNAGTCLVGGTASDSLVTTIGLIKTRLCQTPTFDINALTWGCTVKPSVITTDLQSAFQSVLDGVNDYKQNKLTFSPDFTLSATDPMDPCQGLTVALTAPVVGTDRFVASTALDMAPGTLADKVTPGTNITLDFLTTPGQMIINAPLAADTYKVKADTTDTNPDFLIDKLEGLVNSTDGLYIQDAYDPFTETVQLFPGIDWTVFINKMFDVIQVDAALYARFCELACNCGCDTTTTSTTTLVPPCDDCYSYTYGPAVASCTITWEDCDTGAIQSTYVNIGNSYSVACMREGSGTGCGPWTQGLLCGTYGPGCTTTTTTTSGTATFDIDVTVSNELASTDTASASTNGYTAGTTAAPGATSIPMAGVGPVTVGNSLIFTIVPAGGGTTVTLISLAGFSAPGCTVVATGSGTGTLTITVTPSLYDGSTYYVTGDIDLGVS